MQWTEPVGKLTCGSRAGTAPARHSEGADVSLIVTSDGIDPMTGEKVEFYRPAGPEAERTRLWGTSVIRARFPMLSDVEHDLHVSPPAFEAFEAEARRLAVEAVDVATELGYPDCAPALQRYATACLDAVEFARKYGSESIEYW
jgi:hypothetical protein